MKTLSYIDLSKPLFVINRLKPGINSRIELREKRVFPYGNVLVILKSPVVTTVVTSTDVDPVSIVQLWSIVEVS